MLDIMSRGRFTCCAGVLLVALISVDVPFAQGTPNFSGTWVNPDDPDEDPLEIQHDSTSVTFSVTHQNDRYTYGCKLDGSEQVTRFGELYEISLRAKWDRNILSVFGVLKGIERGPLDFAIELSLNEQGMLVMNNKFWYANFRPVTETRILRRR